MKLFKNVDLCDLASILNEGIKSLNASGNDNWGKGKRATNRTDVVYLFSPRKTNYFPQYGIVLLEVEVEETSKSELCETDYNQGWYDEYIVDYVAPEKITNVYVPSFLKDRVKDYLSKEVFKKITFAEIEAKYYKDFEKVEATKEVLGRFAETAEIESTDCFNFFRGATAERKMIDLKNIKININKGE